jgi:hypothetical protein
MGKDFFSRKSKHDNIYTPYSMTEQLLENEKFDYNKSISDPACGKLLAIVEILKKHFNKTKLWYYDISMGDFVDFLKYNINYNYILTNPPFSLWDEFVEKAKQVAAEKFAFLGRLEFLTGISRFNNKLYQDNNYPLTKVYIFVRKVNLMFNTKWNPEYTELREDGKYPAGMYHYCWFIFENANLYEDKFYNDFIPNHIPVIKFIDNNKYILRKGD